MLFSLVRSSNSITTIIPKRTRSFSFLYCFLLTHIYSSVYIYTQLLARVYAFARCQLMKYQQQAKQLDDERNARSHTERQYVVISSARSKQLCHYLDSLHFYVLSKTMINEPRKKMCMFIFEH